MEHTEILPNITNACRLCLVNNTNIRSIFNNNDNINWLEKDLSRQIFECTNIKVTMFDGTTGICKLCLQELISIIRFRKRCLNIDKYLKKTYCGVYFSQKNLEDITELETKIAANNFITFIDLGSEETIISSIETKEIEDIIFTDYETSDEHLHETDYVDCPIPDQTDDKEKKEHNNEEIPIFSRDQFLVKCTYKLKGGPTLSQYNHSSYPKLKKRDLIEPKAYRGLCHICGREFQHLWVHLQSHSLIPTETCDICGKGFKSKANLHLHVLTHKEAEIPCEICGKKYRTKMRLKRHTRVHTGERPFQCKICQKRFYTKYNLDVHNRTHTGEKPFKCPIEFCHECFTHSYALKQHMERVHQTGV